MNSLHCIPPRTVIISRAILGGHCERPEGRIGFWVDAFECNLGRSRHLPNRDW